MIESSLGLKGAHDLRDIADSLLEFGRVEYIRDGVLMFVPPPGFPHLKIVDSLVSQFIRAKYSGATSGEWDVHPNHLQWEFRDGSKRFFTPDLAVAYPGARSRHELQDNTVLIAEVTSPDMPETVANDRDVKPRQYAKNGVPLYLLIDQERGEWILHSLAEDAPVYDIHSTGAYGVPILLPEPFGFAIETAAWPSYTPEPAE